MLTHRGLALLACAGLLACLLAVATSPQPALALDVEVTPASPAAMPALGKIAERMEKKGFARGAPIYIRIFKEDSSLEVWMQKDGQFALFETYPICKYDGVLGPKLAEGDRQSPEGFYTVSPGQLRWTGRWYRGFDLSFPNAFDTDQGRTGSAILIHGGCGSIGCYAMTNRVIDELFEIATEAFDGGQPRFPVHVFPFRMSAANVAKHKDAAWASFWSRLKPAYDMFETTRTPPMVSVCEAEYRIEPGDVGYDGRRPVERVCITTAGDEIASAEPAATQSPVSKSGMGPLRSRLEEFRKLPPPIEFASVPGKSGKRKGKAVIKAGLVVRCNIKLASCKKWVALRQSAKPKRNEIASAKKRKTASATP